MLTPRDLADLEAALAGPSKLRRGRLRLESSSRRVIGDGFDGYIVEIYDIAYDEDAGVLAVVHEHTASMVSSEVVELRAFLPERDLYRRTAQALEEGMAQAFSNLFDSEAGTDFGLVIEERWSREPIGDAELEGLRSYAASMRDLSFVRRLLVCPEIEVSTTRIDPEATPISGIDGSRCFRLSGPMDAFAGPWLARADFGSDRPLTGEVVLEIWLDVPNGSLTRLRATYPGRASDERAQDSLVVLSTYPASATLRPDPDECLPDLAPLAGSVVQLESRFRAYGLRLRFGGESVDLVVVWRPQYPFAFRMPRPGDQLHLSGTYRQLIPTETDQEPERIWANFLLGTLADQDGILADLAAARSVDQEDPAAAPADFEIFLELGGSDGFLYNYASDLEPGETVPRDDRGLGSYWPDTETFEATVEQVHPYPDRPWLVLEAENGERFADFAPEPGPEGQRSLALHDPVVIYRGWTAGEPRLRWAQDVDGTLVMGQRSLADLLEGT